MGLFRWFLGFEFVDLNLFGRLWFWVWVTVADVGFDGIVFWVLISGRFLFDVGIVLGFLFGLETFASGVCDLEFGWFIVIL